MLLPREREITAAELAEALSTATHDLGAPPHAVLRAVAIPISQGKLVPFARTAIVGVSRGASEDRAVRAGDLVLTENWATVSELANVDKLRAFLSGWVYASGQAADL